MKTKQGSAARAAKVLSLAAAAIAAPIAVGVAAGAAPLAAQTSIDELRPVASDGSVRIGALSHNIRVTAWDRNEIQVRGAYDPEFETFTIRGDQRSVVVEIEPHRDRSGRRSTGSRQLEVRVPAGVRFEAGTVSGNIEVSGLTRAVQAETVSGNVELAGIAVESAHAGTVSGNVRMNGRATVLRVGVVSGGVRIEGEVSDLNVGSVSGGIHVASRAEVRAASLNSVSGGITLAARLASNANVTAETHSGTVDLQLQTPIDARFNLSTFSGRVSVDLPGVADQASTRGRFTPGETMTFTVGSGSATVRANTFSGSVRVRQGG